MTDNNVQALHASIARNDCMQFYLALNAGHGSNSRINRLNPIDQLCLCQLRNNSPGRKFYTWRARVPNEIADCIVAGTGTVWLLLSGIGCCCNISLSPMD